MRGQCVSECGREIAKPIYQWIDRIYPDLSTSTCPDSSNTRYRTHVFAAKGVLRLLPDFDESLPTRRLLLDLRAEGANALARAETPAANANTTKTFFIIVLSHNILQLVVIDETTSCEALSAHPKGNCWGNKLECVC